MIRAIATACVLAMMSFGVRAQQASPQAAPTHKAAPKKTAKKATVKKNAKKEAEAPPPVHQLPAQTMPPVPATLMNSAPVKPIVTMASGKLTIDAPNSTLADVLYEVQKATGASIEGASPTERVVVKLGPGDPEQVIAALLHGTPYDYVILGSLSRRDAVTRVLLTQPSGSAQSVDDKDVSARSLQSPQQGFRSRQPLPNQPSSDDQADSDPEPTTEPQPTQPQPNQPQPNQPQPNQPQPNQMKTPEQLLKELQQLELQKQQQQQQQK